MRNNRIVHIHFKLQTLRVDYKDDIINLGLKKYGKIRKKGSATLCLLRQTQEGKKRILYSTLCDATNTVV